MAKDTKFLDVDNEDSDQTARMRRLILVIVWCTCQEVRFLTIRLVSACMFYNRSYIIWAMPCENVSSGYASFLCYDLHVIRKLTTESESPDDFAHARDEFDSMQFAHARSHIFA